MKGDLDLMSLVIGGYVAVAVTLAVQWKLREIERRAEYQQRDTDLLRDQLRGLSTIVREKETA